MILLVGTDVALLEGLSQSLAALEYAPKVAHDLHEARDLAAAQPPLVLVVQDVFAVTASAEVLHIPLAPGGAIVLYYSPGSGARMLSPAMQRAVLAALALPLERQRLIALVQHVFDRARTTGRRRDTPPEQVAY